MGYRPANDDIKTGNISKTLFKENVSKLTSHLEDPFRREAGSGTTPGQIELIHSPDRANYSQDRNSI